MIERINRWGCGVNQGEMVAEAVARAWSDPDSTCPIGQQAPTILIPSLLDALRELELATPESQDARSQAVLDVLQATDPELYGRVATEFEDLLLTSEWGSKSPASAEHTRRVVVEVAYATDRDRRGDRGHYGGERGDLRHGFIGVSFADDARMCRIEKPRSWPFRFGRDRSPKLDRSAAETPTMAEFAAELRCRIGQALSPELLIFVHGYNVAFDDAVLRTARLAYDLDFRGIPMLFSWPSNGRAMDYLADGANAEWANRDFQEVLDVALRASGAQHVHTVAHSMGNRLLVEWLTSPAAHGVLDQGPGCLGQVVFAAPDVDAGKFLRDVPRFAGPSLRRTLYVSARDKALNASKTLAKNPRAGQAGLGIVVAPGVDTVDASDLDTGLMSHSYVGDHRAVVSDLFYLIGSNLAPSDRFGMRPVANHNGPYWEFRR